MQYCKILQNNFFANSRMQKSISFITDFSKWLWGVFTVFYFENLLLDCLDFVLTTDPRNNKPIAIKLNQLPSGSVVIETLSEESCTGTIEMEAKPSSSRNGETPDTSTMGRVSYDKSGVMYLFMYFFYHFNLLIWRGVRLSYTYK